MSRIMFKKTVVLLFLVSQVFASIPQFQEIPGSSNMNLRKRPARTSPLGVSQLNLSSRSTVSPSDFIPKPDHNLDLDEGFAPIFAFDMDETEPNPMDETEPKPMDVTEPNLNSSISNEIIQKASTETAKQDEFSKLTAGVESTNGFLQTIFDQLTSNPSAVNSLNTLQVLFSMNSRNFETVVRFMLSMDDLQMLAALLVFSKDFVCNNQYQNLKKMHELGVPLKHLVNGFYLTHYAASIGSFSMISYLIDHVGIPIDALAPKTGYSPLQTAMLHGKYEMVIYLIASGAKVGLLDTAAGAIVNDDSFVIAAILHAFDNLNYFHVTDGHNLLTYSVARQSFKVFDMLIASGRVNSLVPDAMGRNIFNMEIPESPVSHLFRQKIQEESNIISDYLSAKL